MIEPTIPNLGVLEAVEIIRSRDPRGVTAEEVAAVRARIEASPAVIVAAGGREAVDRFLQAADAALAAAAEAPKPDVAAVPGLTMPVAARPSRRRVELAVYAAILVTAVGGLYFYLMRGSSPPNVAASKTPAASAAARPGRVKDDRKTPAATVNEADMWQGWQKQCLSPGTAQQQDEWDNTDPQHPRPVKLLMVRCGPLRLTQSCTLGAQDRWLMVHVRPVAVPAEPGHITVTIDGREVAKAPIGTGQSDWPLYVPLENSSSPKRTIEVSFVAHDPKQEVRFWDVRLVEDQTRKPEPESPIVQRLRSTDPKVRVEAAVAAAQVVDPFAVPALVELLKDPSRDVRAQVTITLAKYGLAEQPQHVSAVIGMLNDPDLEIRRYAVDTLMALNSDATWQAVAEAALTHPDVDLRLHITQRVLYHITQRNLGQPHPAVGRMYGKLLDSPHDALRLAAVTGIEALRDPAAVGMFVHALDDPEPGVRRSAATVLAKRPEEAAETVCLAAIPAHADFAVRRIALSRFFSLPTFKLLPVAREALHSPDPGVRYALPSVLGKLPGAESDAMLVQLFESNWNTSYQAIIALAQRPGNIAEEQTIKALAPERGNDVRHIAMRRFTDASLMTPRLAEALRTTAKSREAAARAGIAQMLPALRKGAVEFGFEQGLTAQQAVDALRSPPWSDTFALIVELLDDPNSAVRIRAAAALADDPHPDADAVALRLLSHPEVGLREQAASRFARFAPSMPQASQFAAAALKDSAQSVRYRIGEGLAAWHTPEALALLAPCVDDPYVGLRVVAQKALGRDPALVQDDALLPAEGKVIGPEAIPVLVKLLSDPKPSVRQASAGRLGQRADDAARQSLREASHSHPDLFIRRTAARILSERPPSPAEMDLWRRFVKDPDSEIRESVLQALRKAPAADAIPLMTPLLTDPNQRVCLAAAGLLCDFPDAPGENAALTILSSHTDWEVRRIAVQRFDRVSTPRAIDALGQLLVKCPDMEPRLAALNVLIKTNDGAIAPWLVRMLDDPDRPIRNLSAAILRSRPWPAAVEAMVKALRAHPYLDVRCEAARRFQTMPLPEVLAPLLEAAKHENEELRSEALRALAQYNEPAALAAVVAALKDPLPEVRVTAATALFARRDEASEGAMIVALTSHPDIEVRRLAATRCQTIPTPKAVPALADALKHDDDLLRLLAVQALQNTPAPESIDPLIAALDDMSPPIRAAALAALSPRTDQRAQAAIAAYQARQKKESQ